MTDPERTEAGLESEVEKLTKRVAELEMLKDAHRRIERILRDREDEERRFSDKLAILVDVTNNSDSEVKATVFLRWSVI